MIRRTIATAVVLLIVTTFLGVGSFHLYHRDFFYLRSVHTRADISHRPRLLRIAAELDYNDPRHTAVSMMLAEALIRINEAGLAEKIIAAQLQLYPEDAGLLQAHADALAAKGDVEAADRVFRRLLQLLREKNSTEKKENGS